jgi:hypothetical protein
MSLPGGTLYDMYMTSDYQLFGITIDETVIQFDMSDIARDL